MSGRNFQYSFTKAIGRMIVTPKRRALVLKDELLIENKCLRVNAYKNGPKSPINDTSRKIDFACILSTDRS